MAKIETSDTEVRILLESNEDVWFWDRRFNVFDFLDAVSAPSEASKIADTILHFQTDAGFEFTTDIVRDGFYFRNQSHGTRKWMNEAKPGPGDTIVIARIDEMHYRLYKQPGS